MNQVLIIAGFGSADPDALAGIAVFEKLWR